MGRRANPSETRLAQWLRQTGRNVTGFAAEAGTSVKNISHVRMGHKPRLPLAEKIVAASGGAVTLADIYGAPPPPKPKPQASRQREEHAEAV